MARVLILGDGGTSAATLAAIPGTLVVPVEQSVVDRPNFDVRDLLVEGHLPDVVILGSNLVRDRALAISAQIDAIHPEISVLLIAAPDGALVLQAMRAGVRDVIAPDAAEATLQAAVLSAGEHAARRTVRQVALEPAAGPVDESKVIVVVSPKGGVGKSTIASNLAVGLAKSAPMGVVLVDLDMQFGDIATHLDLSPSHSLIDAFASSGGVDSMLLKTFLTVHPSNFYVLCGAESPAASDRIGPKQVRELLTQLSLQFRYVVVDTGAGLAEHTLAALEEANEVVVVSSMDVASVRNVRKEIEVLAQLNLLPASRHFVLNFADRQSGMGVRDVEAVVGLPVNVVVPRASEVYLSANRGVPVMLDKKGGPAAKSMRQLVKRFDRARRESGKVFHHKGVDIS